MKRLTIRKRKTRMSNFGNLRTKKYVYKIFVESPVFIRRKKCFELRDIDKNMLIGRNRSRRFSEKTFSAPFGRVDDSGKRESPLNENLIGREKQRSMFLRHLLDLPSKGVYLITGYRGTGKTSFVRYCLNEYSENVFARFLRRNVGKAFFWDRIFHFFIIVGVAVLALLINELLEASATDNLGDVVLVVAIPSLIIGVYPFVLAKEHFGEIFGVLPNDSSKKWNKRNSGKSILGMVILLLVGAFIYTLCIVLRIHPFNLILFALIGLPLIYMMGNCVLFDYVKIEGFLKVNNDPNKTRIKIVYWFVLAIKLFLIVSMIFKIFYKKVVEAIDVSQVDFVDNSIMLFFLFGFVMIALVFISVVVNMLDLWLIFINSYSGDRKAGKSSRNSFNYSLEPRFKALSVLLIVLFFALCLVIGFKLSDKGYIDVIVWSSVFLVLCLTERMFMFVGGVRAKIKVNMCILLTILIRSVFLVLIGFIVISPLLVHTDLNNGYIQDSNQEIFFIFSIVIAVYFFLWLEYEYIIRNFGKKIIKNKHSIGGFETYSDSLKMVKGNERLGIDLMNLTIFWFVYRSWLPVHVININLGFEKLEYKRVVESMLTGLKVSLNEKLFSYKSAFANIIRAIVVVVLLITVNYFGELWFVGRGKTSSKIVYDYLESECFCDEYGQRRLNNYAEPGSSNFEELRGPFMITALCPLIGDKGVSLIRTRLLIVGEESNGNKNTKNDRFVLKKIIPHKLDSDVVEIRLYHIILMFLFYFVGKVIKRRFRLEPYKKIMNDIDNLLDCISGTITKNRGESLNISNSILGIGRLGSSTQGFSSAPYDSRAIEIRLLQILQLLQDPGVQFPGGLSHRLSLPRPEITFVFDELDKIGAPSAESVRVDTPTVTEFEISDSERARSHAVHKLLADMKNLLSSGSARFIFVGGRNLHDEWHADQSLRRPLLTNVFNFEIYLPSLINDHLKGEKGFDNRVRFYLDSAYYKCRKSFEKYSKLINLPAFSHLLIDYKDDAFFTSGSEDVRKGNNFILSNCNKWLVPKVSKENVKYERKPLHLRDPHTAEIPIWYDWFLECFVGFLTYRSMGNPKRLKELLESFVGTVHRDVINSDIRRVYFCCDHVLRFSWRERYRVLLVSEVYNTLKSCFSEKMYHSDDKISTSIFYLSDYVLKFHRRAFSWEAIERVDELVHIHRAPDLRGILKTMVRLWSDIYLFPIRNGMYDYRLRSEYAKELNCLSRLSEPELAALNFTLDEAQSLKMRYESILKNKTGIEAIEYRSALGELHEFDEEFESAREYYYLILDTLDSQLLKIFGNNVGPFLGYQESSRNVTLTRSLSLVPCLLNLDYFSLRILRTNSSWSINRIRFMLRIAMTYELSANYEKAQVWYQDAMILSNAVIFSLIDDKGREKIKSLLFDPKKEKMGPLIDSLKELQIVFQAIFALAWISEKLVSAVDTAPALLEAQIAQLYSCLPFIREKGIPELKSNEIAKHGNFSLVASELRDKLGDLYFFKGRQFHPPACLDDLKSNSAWRFQNEGYLTSACANYGLALYEIRRFCIYRLKASAKKNSHVLSKGSTVPMFVEFLWPEFVVRSCAGSLDDMSETLLSRVSLYGLVTDKEQSIKPFDIDSLYTATKIINRYFTEENPCNLEISIGSISLGKVENWFGKVNEKSIKFSGMNSDWQRLHMALLQSYTSGHLLMENGFHEESLHVFSQIIQSVNHFLFSGLFFMKIVSDVQVDNTLLSWFQIFKTSPDPKYVANLEVNDERWRSIILHAYSAIRCVEKILDSKVDQEKIDIINNGVFGGIVCSSAFLGFLEKKLFQCRVNGSEVSSQSNEYLRNFLNRSDVLGNVSFKKFDTLSNVSFFLEKFLEKKPYPILNQLHGIRMLIIILLTEFNNKFGSLSFSENNECHMIGNCHVSKEDIVLDDDDKLFLKICGLMEELIFLEKFFEGPLHFTSFELGSVCLFFNLSLRKYKSKYSCFEECPNLHNELLQEIVNALGTIDRSRKVGLFKLRESLEMISQGSAYYKNIADLYYLYEDFNDRDIHYNHSIQMASCELSNILLEIFKNENSVFV